MERNELTWKLGVVLSLAEEFLNHWQERNAEEDDREEEQQRKETGKGFLDAKPHRSFQKHRRSGPEKERIQP
jgi:hypothetical protein